MNKEDKSRNGNTQKANLAQKASEVQLVESVWGNIGACLHLPLYCPRHPPCHSQRWDNRVWTLFSTSVPMFCSTTKLSKSGAALVFLPVVVFLHCQGSIAIESTKEQCGPASTSRVRVQRGASLSWSQHRWEPVNLAVLSSSFPVQEELLGSKITIRGSVLLLIRS